MSGHRYSDAHRRRRRDSRPYDNGGDGYTAPVAAPATVSYQPYSQAVQHSRPRQIDSPATNALRNQQPLPPAPPLGSSSPPAKPSPPPPRQNAPPPANQQMPLRQQPPPGAYSYPYQAPYPDPRYQGYPPPDVPYMAPQGQFPASYGYMAYPLVQPYMQAPYGAPSQAMPRQNLSHPNAPPSQYISQSVTPVVHHQAPGGGGIQRPRSRNSDSSGRSSRSSYRSQRLRRKRSRKGILGFIVGSSSKTKKAQRRRSLVKITGSGSNLNRVNSSSSSLNSDLAYGHGYVDRPSDSGSDSDSGLVYPVMQLQPHMYPYPAPYGYYSPAHYPGMYASGMPIPPISYQGSQPPSVRPSSSSTNNTVTRTVAGAAVGGMMAHALKEGRGLAPVPQGKESVSGGSTPRPTQKAVAAPVSAPAPMELPKNLKKQKSRASLNSMKKNRRQPGTPEDLDAELKAIANDLMDLDRLTSGYGTSTTKRKGKGKGKGKGKERIPRQTSMDLNLAYEPSDSEWSDIDEEEDDDSIVSGSSSSSDGLAYGGSSQFSKYSTPKQPAHDVNVWSSADQPRLRPSSRSRPPLVSQPRDLPLQQPRAKTRKVDPEVFNMTSPTEQRKISNGSVASSIASVMNPFGTAFSSLISPRSAKFPDNAQQRRESITDNEKQKPVEDRIYVQRQQPLEPPKTNESARLNVFDYQVSQSAFPTPIHSPPHRYAQPPGMSLISPRRGQPSSVPTGPFSPTETRKASNNVIPGVLVGPPGEAIAAAYVEEPVDSRRSSATSTRSVDPQKAKLRHPAIVSSTTACPPSTVVSPPRSGSSHHEHHPSTPTRAPASQRQSREAVEYRPKVNKQTSVSRVSQTNFEPPLKGILKPTPPSRPEATVTPPAEVKDRPVEKREAKERLERIPEKPTRKEEERLQTSGRIERPAEVIVEKQESQRIEQPVPGAISDTMKLAALAGLTGYAGKKLIESSASKERPVEIIEEIQPKLAPVAKVVAPVTKDVASPTREIEAPQALKVTEHREPKQIEAVLAPTPVPVKEIEAPRVVKEVESSNPKVIEATPVIDPTVIRTASPPAEFMTAIPKGFSRDTHHIIDVAPPDDLEGEFEHPDEILRKFREHRGESESRRGRSRSGRPGSRRHTDSDPVIDEANRAYAEFSRECRRRSEEIRQQSVSPDDSVMNKYDADKNTAALIADVDHEAFSKTEHYPVPDADVRIDRIIDHPKKVCEAMTSGSSGPVRDPSAERPRPALHIIRPTPEVSPAPRSRHESPVIDRPRDLEGIVEQFELTPSPHSQPPAAPAPVQPAVTHAVVEIAPNIVSQIVSEPERLKSSGGTWWSSVVAATGAAANAGAAAATIAGTAASAAIKNAAAAREAVAKKPAQEIPLEEPRALLGVLSEAVQGPAVVAPRVEEKRPETPPAVEHAREEEVISDIDDTSEPIPAYEPTSPIPAHATHIPSEDAIADCDVKRSSCVLDGEELAAVVGAALKISKFDDTIVTDEPSFFRRSSPPGAGDALVQFRPTAEPQAERVSSRPQSRAIERIEEEEVPGSPGKASSANIGNSWRSTDSKLLSNSQRRAMRRRERMARKSMGEIDLSDNDSILDSPTVETSEKFAEVSRPESPAKQLTEEEIMRDRHWVPVTPSPPERIEYSEPVKEEIKESVTETPLLPAVEEPVVSIPPRVDSIPLTIDIPEKRSEPVKLAEEFTIDPEIIPRHPARPSIDPEYNDLLMLPPSEPGSPEEAIPGVNIALPDSRPESPPHLGTPVSSHYRKNSETPTRSPSNTAIPIGFIRPRSGANLSARSSPGNSPVNMESLHRLSRSVDRTIRGSGPIPLCLPHSRLEPSLSTGSSDRSNGDAAVYERRRSHSESNLTGVNVDELLKRPLTQESDTTRLNLDTLTEEHNIGDVEEAKTAEPETNAVVTPPAPLHSSEEGTESSDSAVLDRRRSSSQSYNVGLGIENVSMDNEAEVFKEEPAVPVENVADTPDHISRPATPVSREMVEIPKETVSKEISHNEPAAAELLHEETKTTTPVLAPAAESVVPATPKFNDDIVEVKPTVVATPSMDTETPRRLSPGLGSFVGAIGGLLAGRSIERPKTPSMDIDVPVPESSRTLQDAVSEEPKVNEPCFDDVDDILKGPEMGERQRFFVSQPNVEVADEIQALPDEPDVATEIPASSHQSRRASPILDRAEIPTDIPVDILAEQETTASTEIDYSHVTTAPPIPSSPSMSSEDESDSEFTASTPGTPGTPGFALTRKQKRKLRKQRKKKELAALKAAAAAKRTPDLLVTSGSVDQTLSKMSTGREMERFEDIQVPEKVKEEIEEEKREEAYEVPELETMQEHLLSKDALVSIEPVHEVAAPVQVVAEPDIEIPGHSGVQLAIEHVSEPETGNVSESQPQEPETTTVALPIETSHEIVPDVAAAEPHKTAAPIVDEIIEVIPVKDDVPASNPAPVAEEIYEPLIERLVTPALKETLPTVSSPVLDVPTPVETVAEPVFEPYTERSVMPEIEDIVPVTTSPIHAVTPVAEHVFETAAKEVWDPEPVEQVVEETVVPVVITGGHMSVPIEEVTREVAEPAVEEVTVISRAGTPPVDAASEHTVEFATEAPVERSVNTSAEITKPFPCFVTPVATSPAAKAPSKEFIAGAPVREEPNYEKDPEAFYRTPVLGAVSAEEVPVEKPLHLEPPVDEPVEQSESELAFEDAVESVPGPVEEIVESTHEVPVQSEPVRAVTPETFQQPIIESTTAPVIEETVQLVVEPTSVTAEDVVKPVQIVTEPVETISKPIKAAVEPAPLGEFPATVPEIDELPREMERLQSEDIDTAIEIEKPIVPAEITEPEGTEVPVQSPRAATEPAVDVPVIEELPTTESAIEAEVIPVTETQVTGHPTVLLLHESAGDVTPTVETESVSEADVTVSPIVDPPGMEAHADQPLAITEPEASDPVVIEDITASESVGNVAFEVDQHVPVPNESLPVSREIEDIESDAPTEQKTSPDVETEVESEVQVPVETVVESAPESVVPKPDTKSVVPLRLTSEVTEAHADTADKVTQAPVSDTPIAVGSPVVASATQDVQAPEASLNESREPSQVPETSREIVKEPTSAVKETSIEPEAKETVELISTETEKAEEVVPGPVTEVEEVPAISPIVQTVVEEVDKEIAEPVVEPAVEAVEEGATEPVAVALVVEGAAESDVGITREVPAVETVPVRQPESASTVSDQIVPEHAAQSKVAEPGPESERPIVLEEHAQGVVIIPTENVQESVTESPTDQITESTSLANKRKSVSWPAQEVSDIISQPPVSPPVASPAAVEHTSSVELVPISPYPPSPVIPASHPVSFGSPNNIALVDSPTSSPASSSSDSFDPPPRSTTPIQFQLKTVPEQISDSEGDIFDSNSDNDAEDEVSPSSGSPEALQEGDDEVQDEEPDKLVRAITPPYPMHQELDPIAEVSESTGSSVGGSGVTSPSEDVDMEISALLGLVPESTSAQPIVQEIESGVPQEAEEADETIIRPSTPEAAPVGQESAVTPTINTPKIDSHPTFESDNFQSSHPEPQFDDHDVLFSPTEPQAPIFPDVVPTEQRAIQEPRFLAPPAEIHSDVSSVSDTNYETSSEGVAAVELEQIHTPRAMVPVSTSEGGHFDVETDVDPISLDNSPTLDRPGVMGTPTQVPPAFRNLYGLQGKGSLSSPQGLTRIRSPTQDVSTFLMPLTNEHAENSDGDVTSVVSDREDEVVESKPVVAPAFRSSVINHWPMAGPIGISRGLLAQAELIEPEQTQEATPKPSPKEKEIETFESQPQNATTKVVVEDVPKDAEVPESALTEPTVEKSPAVVGESAANQGTSIIKTPDINQDVVVDTGNKKNRWKKALKLVNFVNAFEPGRKSGDTPVLEANFSFDHPPLDAPESAKEESPYDVSGLGLTTPTNIHETIVTNVKTEKSVPEVTERASDIPVFTFDPAPEVTEDATSLSPVDKLILENPQGGLTSGLAAPPSFDLRKGTGPVTPQVEAGDPLNSGPEPSFNSPDPMQVASEKFVGPFMISEPAIHGGLLAEPTFTPDKKSMAKTPSLDTGDEWSQSAPERPEPDALDSSSEPTGAAVEVVSTGLPGPMDTPLPPSPASLTTSRDASMMSLDQADQSSDNSDGALAESAVEAAGGVVVQENEAAAETGETQLVISGTFLDDDVVDVTEDRGIDSRAEEIDQVVGVPLHEEDDDIVEVDSTSAVDEIDESSQASTPEVVENAVVPVEEVLVATVKPAIVAEEIAKEIALPEPPVGEPEQPENIDSSSADVATADVPIVTDESTVDAPPIEPIAEVQSADVDKASIVEQVPYVTGVKPDVTAKHSAMTDVVAADTTIPDSTESSRSFLLQLSPTINTDATLPITIELSTADIESAPTAPSPTGDCDIDNESLPLEAPADASIGPSIPPANPVANVESQPGSQSAIPPASTTLIVPPSPSPSGSSVQDDLYVGMSRSQRKKAAREAFEALRRVGEAKEKEENKQKEEDAKEELEFVVAQEPVLEMVPETEVTEQIAREVTEAEITVAAEVAEPVVETATEIPAAVETVEPIDVPELTEPTEPTKEIASGFPPVVVPIEGDEYPDAIDVIESQEPAVLDGIVKPREPEQDSHDEVEAMAVTESEAPEESATEESDFVDASEVIGPAEEVTVVPVTEDITEQPTAKEPVADIPQQFNVKEPPKPVTEGLSAQYVPETLAETGAGIAQPEVLIEPEVPVPVEAVSEVPEVSENLAPLQTESVSADEPEVQERAVTPDFGTIEEFVIHPVDSIKHKESPQPVATLEAEPVSQEVEIPEAETSIIPLSQDVQGLFGSMVWPTSLSGPIEEPHAIDSQVEEPALTFVPEAPKTELVPEPTTLKELPQTIHDDWRPVRKNSKNRRDHSRYSGASSVESQNDEEVTVVPNEEVPPMSPVDPAKIEVLEQAVEKSVEIAPEPAVEEVAETVKPNEDVVETGVEAVPEPEAQLIVQEIVRDIVEPTEVKEIFEDVPVATSEIEEPTTSTALVPATSPTQPIAIDTIVEDASALPETSLVTDSHNIEGNTSFSLGIPESVDLIRTPRLGPDSTLFADEPNFDDSFDLDGNNDISFSGGPSMTEHFSAQRLLILPSRLREMEVTGPVEETPAVAEQAVTQPEAVVGSTPEFTPMEAAPVETSQAIEAFPTAPFLVVKEPTPSTSCANTPDPDTQEKKKKIPPSEYVNNSWFPRRRSRSRSRSRNRSMDLSKNTLAVEVVTSPTDSRGRLGLPVARKMLEVPKVEEPAEEKKNKQELVVLEVPKAEKIDVASKVEVFVPEVKTQPESAIEPVVIEELEKPEDSTSEAVAPESKPAPRPVVVKAPKEITVPEPEVTVIPVPTVEKPKAIITAGFSDDGVDDIDDKIDSVDDGPNASHDTNITALSPTHSSTRNTWFSTIWSFNNLTKKEPVKPREESYHVPDEDELDSNLGVNEPAEEEPRVQLPGAFEPELKPKPVFHALPPVPSVSETSSKEASTPGPKSKVKTEKLETAIDTDTAFLSRKKRYNHKSVNLDTDLDLAAEEGPRLTLEALEKHSAHDRSNSPDLKRLAPVDAISELAPMSEIGADWSSGLPEQPAVPNTLPTFTSINEDDEDQDLDFSSSLSKQNNKRRSRNRRSLMIQAEAISEDNESAALEIPAPVSAMNMLDFPSDDFHKTLPPRGHGKSSESVFSDYGLNEGAMSVMPEYNTYEETMAEYAPNNDRLKHAKSIAEMSDVGSVASIAAYDDNEKKWWQKQSFGESSAKKRAQWAPETPARTPFPTLTRAASRPQMYLHDLRNPGGEPLGKPREISSARDTQNGLLGLRRTGSTISSRSQEIAQAGKITNKRQSSIYRANEIAQIGETLSGGVSRIADAFGGQTKAVAMVRKTSSRSLLSNEVIVDEKLADDVKPEIQEEKEEDIEKLLELKKKSIEEELKRKKELEECCINDLIARLRAEGRHNDVIKRAQSPVVLDDASIGSNQSREASPSPVFSRPRRAKTSIGTIMYDQGNKIKTVRSMIDMKDISSGDDNIDSDADSSVSTRISPSRKAGTLPRVPEVGDEPQPAPLGPAVSFSARTRSLTTMPRSTTPVDRGRSSTPKLGDDSPRRHSGISLTRDSPEKLTPRRTHMFRKVSPDNADPVKPLHPMQYHDSLFTQSPVPTNSKTKILEPSPEATKPEPVKGRELPLSNKNVNRILDYQRPASPAGSVRSRKSMFRASAEELVAAPSGNRSVSDSFGLHRSNTLPVGGVLLPELSSNTGKPVQRRVSSSNIGQPRSSTPTTDEFPNLLLTRTIRRLPGKIGGTASMTNLNQEFGDDNRKSLGDPIDMVDTGTTFANSSRKRSEEAAPVQEGPVEYDAMGTASPAGARTSMRRRSMQVLELTNKVDQLLLENQHLREERENFEVGIARQAASMLTERNHEVDNLKTNLLQVRKELARLHEVNKGLKETNRSLSSQNAQNEEELAHTRAIHEDVDKAIAERDAEINSLRQQLEDSRNRIRELQAQILANAGAPETYLTIRDEDYFDNRCNVLFQHVSQWILRFSKFSDMKTCVPTLHIQDEKILDRLDNAVLDGTNVDHYLRDRVKRRDVFMSVTMNMIWEFVFTRFLFGMDREQRGKLKQLEKHLYDIGPPAAVRQWRAITLTLLSKRDNFRKQRHQDTEAVVQAILVTLSTLLPPPQHLQQQVQSQLRRVLHEAVDLSIEMRKQKAEYKILPPPQPEYDTNGDLMEPVPFRAATMHVTGASASRLTETPQELEARGATVRMILFPLVVKKANDAGEGDDEIVVYPAQVILANSGTRKLSTQSSDAGGVSVHSQMPDDSQASM